MQIQQRIENYWQGAASRYSNNIWKEMNSFKKDAWAALIDEHRSAGESLKVLDIGTGPGFFAMLLSGMGHTVTAIDCTENMLVEAGYNVQKVGFHVQFYKMDSHVLDFPEGTFDLIVCRNLTWTLRDPVQAYREWHRVLKPGGKLMVFDANWHLRLFDPEMDRLYREDKERARQMGIPDSHDQSNMEESDKIARQLYLSSRRRPDWDESALLEAGFCKLIIDEDISGKVWDAHDRVLYRSTPMFMLVAEK
ncbi:Methyltransferase type 11 [Desulfofarcimen acetoxidans DSM 771]|uniref:Methyltransferase type 11 n=1 Tax=Desulfofarcimen acetoxidans (strain ATCC 49208 / DSM 771 / KCTC 5769 / VKM B-1644 / 5575) TaxID=485916 RepID=C8W4V3_DESAS|nr:class I SAM-dependent methyltransferase [Desulfofarcimen acetoxidans]ACV61305.1 Methyltransferase type 11 [Desulfofarcimen acetoxidans DSM 771]